MINFGAISVKILVKEIERFTRLYNIIIKKDQNYRKQELKKLTLPKNTQIQTLDENSQIFCKDLWREFIKTGAPFTAGDNMGVTFICFHVLFNIYFIPRMYTCRSKPFIAQLHSILSGSTYLPIRLCQWYLWIYKIETKSTVGEMSGAVFTHSLWHSITFRTPIN